MAAEYLERMGARIREAREAKGLSQAGLARLLPGTTDGNQISRWELGKHRPSDDTLEALAVALDVSVSSLLAAAGEKDGQTPDPFGHDVNNVTIEQRLDQLEAALRDMTQAATEERASIMRLLQTQQELLEAQTRILQRMEAVAAGLPGDDTLQALTAAARQLEQASRDDGADTAGPSAEAG